MDTQSTDRLAEGILALSQVLLDDEALDTALHRTAALAVALIPDCDTCGVTLTKHGKMSTPVATDELARRVDGYQYSAGEGPCLEAVRTGRAYRIDSMADDTTWPAFSASALSEGISASYSVPLTVGVTTVGALNLYSVTGTFGPQEAAVADDFGHQAAIILANARAYDECRELVENLTQALYSRDVIGQAKGIIMERDKCTADDAFGVLRQASQSRNMKLRDVAQDVVETGSWDDSREVQIHHVR